MRRIAVTHGTSDRGAAALLERFQRESGRQLGEPLELRTLDDLGSDLKEGDRVYALFFTYGGHLDRDLMPLVERAGASFAGAIPPSIVARQVLSWLAQQDVRKGRSVVLVGVKARTEPRKKLASLQAVCERVEAAGYPCGAGLYDDPATLQEPPPGRSPPIAILLTLLPGYTLSRASGILRAHGYETWAEPWLPLIADELLRWMSFDLSTTPTGPEAGP